MLLISLILIGVGSYRLRKYISSREWVTCNATIREYRESYKEVAQSQFSSAKYYFPIVTYEYFFSGHQYTSSAVSPHIRNIWVCEVNNWGDLIKEKDKFWNSWSANKEIKISINPNNPTECYVVKEQSALHKSHNYALVTSGILISIFWLFLIIQEY